MLDPPQELPAFLVQRAWRHDPVAVKVLAFRAFKARRFLHSQAHEAPTGAFTHAGVRHGLDGPGADAADHGGILDDALPDGAP
jgi:hypothetical protein